MTAFRAFSKPQRRFTEIERRDIARRYKAGEMLRVIAQAHGTKAAIVSSLAHRMGLPKRRQGPQPKV